MAYSEDDIIRLVTQYSGQAAAAEQERDLRRLTEAQQELDRAYVDGNVTQANYDRYTATHTAALKDHARELLRIEESMRKAGLSTRNFGYALLNAGRSVQDFQAAGLMGILNNIESLVMNLGGTAGLAGVLTAVAVGFQVLRPQISAFFASLSRNDVERFTGSLSALQATVKELTEKEHKVAIDFARLDAAQAALETLQSGLAAFDAAAKARTSAQQQQAQRVQEAITEFGGGTDQESGAKNIAAIIEQIRRREGTFYRGPGAAAGQAERSRLEQEFKRAEESLGFAQRDPTADTTVAQGIRDAIKERLDKLNRDLDTAAREAIKSELIGGALQGKEAQRAELERLFEANRPEFGRSGVNAAFGEGIHGAAPDVRKQQEEFERQGAENARRIVEHQKEVEEQRRIGQQLAEQGARQQTEDEERRVKEAEAVAKGELTQAQRDQQERARLRLQQRRDQERQGEAEEKELERALGGKAGQGDVEEAGNRLLGVAGIRNPNQRARAAAQLDEEFKRHAFRRIVEAEPGVDPERAEAMAAEAPAFYREAAERQLQLQGQQVQALAQMQAQANGAVAANQAAFNNELRMIRQQINLLHRVRAAMTPQGENFRDF